MKLNKMSLALIVMAVLLISAVGYIVLDTMNEQQLAQMQLIYQQGFNEGYNNAFLNAVQTLFLQTDNCQTTVITAGNFTRELVDTACLTLPE